MLDKNEVREIRAMLLVADLTFTDLANKFDVSRETIYKAVRNENKSTASKVIRAYIEEKVGHVEVWHI